MADEDNNNNNLPPETPSNEPPTLETSGDQPPAQEFSFDEAALDDPDEAALNRKGSSIGGSSGKAITFGAALLLGTGIILYYLFSDSPPPPQQIAGGVVPTKPSGEIVAQPSSAPPANVGIAPPTMPTAPPAPPPPPPPPPPPAPPAAVKAANAPPPKPQAPLAPPEIKPISGAEATAANTAAIDKRMATRMRSNMLLMNSAPGGATPEQRQAREGIASNDPNSAFANDVIEATSSESVTATKVNNLQSTIAQGKIVNAVLETALNTDLPGTLRAIISRDVYAEAGKNVLIPKGSRLIGTYNTSVFRGQKRVFIIWTRVITPEGLDIAIGSPGVDSLGRAGVAGHVDNKYMESFSAAILTSLVSLGIGVAADSLIDSNNATTSSNTDGSSTSTGSAGNNSVNEGVRSVGQVSTSIVGNLADLRPTITIDQGTRINVFVNKDLIIPRQAASGSMFVQ